MEFQFSEGTPSPLGLSLNEDVANFSLFSSHATQVFLGLFWDKNEQKIPMKRTGDIWHLAVQGLSPDISYAFQCEGPSELRYKGDVWLADPYAKILKDFTKTQVDLPKPFEWKGIEPPIIDREDLVIYEAHVRGFTKDPSSEVEKPGTYLGFIEKIPHLKKLGINAVELMPIFDFDETAGMEAPLVNYWGYNPTHYFAPKKWYATSNPVDEFKTLVRELHKNGILVILDVVYNHTGEGGDGYVNFRGIDDSVYYMLNENKEYLNYSGCSNTLNHNHPIVQQLIIDSLMYWAVEMRVDGFRFDLASIFTRGPNGEILDKPPIVEMISNNPILGKKILIAEAWDAAGLYQVGHFSNQWNNWSEWNGRYRDTIRKFIKGTDGVAGDFASALCGSEMIYGNSQGPSSSINFITAHDGFTLRDLVTYQFKRNWPNREENNDGANCNENWNCGVEGLTNEPHINALREKQMRNFLLTLFVSQGTPMLLMGDEYGHTSKGNNNPFAQDNEINWFLWDLLELHHKIFKFTNTLIAFRKQHPQLKKDHFLKHEDVQWHTNWSHTSRLVFFTLNKDQPICFIFNANYHHAEIDLPPGHWKKIVDTNEDWQLHHNGVTLSSKIKVPPHSSLLLLREG